MRLLFHRRSTNWRNAKKERDELPVIQAISHEKRRNRTIPLKRFIPAGQLSVSTFFRYEHRMALGQPLWPRGEAPGRHDGRRCHFTASETTTAAWKSSSLRAVSALQAQHPEYSGRRFQELANKLRLRLLRGERKSTLSVEYCEAHPI